MSLTAPSSRLVRARLLFTGLLIVLRTTWARTVSLHRTTPPSLRNDLLFIAGVVVLGVASTATLLVDYSTGDVFSNSTPLFATAAAGLFWVAACLGHHVIRPLRHAHIVLWMFLPGAPVLFTLFSWLSTHRQDLVFSAAFLPAGALVACALVFAAARGVRAVANTLVQTSLGAMSAHQRLALLEQEARTRMTNRPS